ncbi:hypothetical protein V5P93_004373 [Actinokineospora auranticolor]|uniref:Dynamin family protein n=1 Tax=Actinokineospora auranticolor TaxID=155976 RepID=A0A2S6GTK3_9PSEU|nr:hypothetical protein [Actinokineospora auranticolor]PPK68519.1 dynamin family protein [Actinokineospora auranticolor]
MDTPGVGGVYEAHTAATTAFLPSAHAVLFVTDTTQPLMESELRFLARATSAARAEGDDDGTVFVMTRADAAVDQATRLANTRAKLAEVTGRPAEGIVVVPVSSTAHHAYLEFGDDEDRELGNLDGLSDLLWDTLARRRVRVVLGDALGSARAGAEALLRPVEAASAALRASSAEEAQRLEDEIVRAQRRTAELREGRGWTEALRRDLDAVAADLRERARSGVEAIWDEVDTGDLFDERMLAEPQPILDRIGEETTDLVSDLNRRMTKRVRAVFTETARSTGLSLTGKESRDLDLPGERTVTGRLGTENLPGSALGQIRDGGLGAGIGATIGAALLGPVGLWLGSVVGGLLGRSRAVRAARHQEAQARRASLVAELRPLRRDQHRAIIEGVQERMRELTRAAVAEITALARQEDEALTSSLVGLREARTRTGAERELAVLAAREAELRRVLAEVSALETEVSALADRTTA